jgi:hypothetical protein
MNLRTAAVVGLALTSLVAGCGGGSDRTSGGSDGTSGSGHASTTDPRAALLEVARCYRSHGYANFPDPVEMNGRWGFPDSAPRVRRDPPTCLQLARSAKELIGGKAPKLSTAEIARLRSFAGCMRQHGVADWPDPDPDGEFRLPARLMGPNGKPRLLPQTRACRAYLPEKGILVPRQGGSR